MDFGLYIRSVKTYSNMLELTRHAENLGYFGVFLNDHVHGFANEGKEPYLEAWTTITALGAQTSKIRVGHVVLFNSLRNPAYLAKSIATLDVITNGRYEVLMGAGWNEPEYKGYDLMGKGRGMPSAKERVDRFEEAIQIVKGMLHNPVFSFNGTYWKLENAINIPQPVQNPMRISVGASKSRMIRIACKYADGFNIPGNLQTIQTITEKIKAELERLGRSYDDFYISGFTGMKIAKNQDELLQHAKERAKVTKKTVQETLEYDFIGTEEMLLDKLRQAKDKGVKLFILAPRDITDVNEAKQAIDLFKDKIINHL